MPQTPHGSVRSCTPFVLLLTFLFVTLPFGFVTDSFAQKLDYNGNYVFEDAKPEPAHLPLAPGDIVNSFPNPGDLLGLAFRDGNLRRVDRNAMLLEMSPVDGAVLRAQAVPGAGDNLFGLGWDSARLEFIMTDALADVIHRIDDGGNIVATLPAPGIGPLGAAYDPVRDGYWITDWEEERLYLVAPTTLKMTISGFISPTTFASGSIERATLRLRSFESIL